MAAKFTLKILTPQGIFLEKQVEIATVRTITGYIGIMAHHIPIVSTLVPADISYRQDGKKFEVNINGGILQVDNNVMKIITDDASWIKKIIN